MKRGDNYIVAIDLETGGFEPGRHSILAIGAYFRVTEARVGEIGEYSLRLLVEREPDTVVDPAAAAKCGWVSDEQWLEEGAVPLRGALELFDLWLMRLEEKVGRFQGSAGASPHPHPYPFELLAHNHAGVDRPFLEYWMERCGMREMFFGEDGLLSHAWHDSMLALRAAQVAGLVPSGGASLDAMLRAMGRTPRPAEHDALYDARACFDGYHWLTFLMARGNGPESGKAQQEIRPTGCEEAERRVA